MDILEETLRLLRATDEPYARIARAIGVSPKYLHRLAAGEYEDPGVKKIHRLYAHLTRSTEDQAA